MSATRQTTIWCDGPLNDKSCVKWDQRTGPATLLRKELFGYGWVRRKNYDLCPDCAKKELDLKGDK